ncbi:MAG: hypothetical protein HS117_13405 [Verrucomicrobiaceae bacterium]|nr:hypothetical protein [Verrucomicrobiaceae bacterium]
MPFDPDKPANGSPLSSAEMRGQLGGLKDLIDALSTITSAQVDAVNTLNPGDPASVGLTVSGGVLHFTFGIPAGATGADGGPGPEGPQGPPFADAVVDGVTTLAPGDPATVEVTFDGTNVRFTFGIPQGAPGAQGETGPPGEVTQAALDAEIAATALNPAGVSPLGLTADASYDQGQMQAVIDKLDELRAALAR